ncbi:MAG: branched-chain amino acid transport system II carrier protein [Silvanigrellaceae bacterium]|nr:branched-chain amino acid transport system II carrier protein [Silvanigrellaceae bacterium]
MNVKVWVAGFAVFAMFFGSGNLVFPLMLGVETGIHWLYPAIGICLTGVLVPLIGLASMILFKGNVDQFFSTLGPIGKIMLPSFILLIIGPLAAIPRCITVAHGAFLKIMPSSSFVIFSAAYCLLLWFATRYRGKLIDVIGRYFTPIKLVLLCIVIVGSLIASPDILPSENGTFSSTGKSFLIGLQSGYHTMDFLATFFFAAGVVTFFNQGNTKKQVASFSLKAMLVGMTLLSLVYFILVYLGAAYAPALINYRPEEMLPQIAQLAMGNSSAYLISLTLIVACLTTAVALTFVFVDYFCERNKWLLHHRSKIVYFSLLLTFLISQFQFSGIMKLLGPLLNFIYPLVIFYTVLNVFLKIKKNKAKNALV